MAAKAAQPERGRAWDGVLRREIDVEFRSLNEEERSFEVIASTETLDSHGDVMKQFWDLSRFEKNGAVLWNHNRFGVSPYAYEGALRPEDLLTIGKAENVRVEGKKLVAKIYLLKAESDKEPLVDKIWRRVQQGMQKAVSVGFKAGQVTAIQDAAGHTTHYELGSKERPNELREISLVPMGSNPDAVAKSIAWERECLAAEITKTMPAEGGSNNEKTMNEELQKALEAKAVAEQKLKDITTRAETAEGRVKTLEAEVTAEKAMNVKLTSDLAAANEQLKVAKGATSKATLDALQGVKFAPAEREELDKMVEIAGIDRVKALLEKRADISLTQPATAAGAELGDKSKGAPPPVDTSANPDAGSDDLLKAANEGASKAVA